MKIIKPSVEILNKNLSEKEVLKNLENIGRVCYKSEKFITEDSYINFIKKIIRNNHLSILEHFSISVRIICDRGVSHELVRHRIASYSQESTRYVKYDDLEVIMPCFFSEFSSDCKLKYWEEAMKQAEHWYTGLIESGCTPQEARAVLPNSLKTEIIVTMNLRSWRHFLKLRCSPAAHPQMIQIAYILLEKMYNYLPIIFNDLWENFSNERKMGSS